MTTAKKAATPATPKPKPTKAEPNTIFAIGLGQHLVGEVSNELRSKIKADGEAWGIPTYHLDHATRLTTVVWEYVDYDNLVPGPQYGEIRKVKLV